MSTTPHLITRCDYRSRRGYWVRIVRNTMPRPLHRFFYKGQHGGWRPALEAAKTWRDRQLARLDQPLKAIVTHVRPMRDNPTGILGVYKTRKKCRGRYTCPSVIATLRTGSNRSFSIKKYGLKRATEMAIAARKKSEREFLKAK